VPVPTTPIPAPRPTTPVLVADRQPRVVVVRPAVAAPPPSVVPVAPAAGQAPTATTAYREGADEGAYQEGAPAQVQGRTGALPYTGGTDTAIIVALGLALLSGGGLLVLSARRRDRDLVLRRGRR
jgi:LPXTG-motif cell wall-anchored protein